VLHPSKQAGSMGGHTRTTSTWQQGGVNKVQSFITLTNRHAIRIWLIAAARACKLSIL